MSYLQISGLKISYGDKVVLHNIDLAVEQGEMIALLGPSGCGKTTLLNALCGFIPVQSGEVAIASRTITHLAPEQRNITMVFQSYALWPHLTVARNIGYGLKLRKWRGADIARRVAELLRIVNLEGLGEVKVTELSGGQRQRGALARALAIEPQVLVLDEPLSNLDAKVRLNVRHEIKSLQKRLGFTSLIVTHDQQEALVMADRIAVLNQGRIEQTGTPEEIYQRPATPFVADFMGADNKIISGELSAAAISGLSAAQQGDNVIYFRSADAALAELTQPAPQEGLALEGVVEDCVNKVGVDLNTASASLLEYVSGINKTLAKNIVAYREENGAFKSRKQLLKVAKLGPKAFEQCAGFMRITGGENPLDGTSVHPESYDAAGKLLEKLGYKPEELSGGGLLGISRKIKDYKRTAQDLGIGEITLRDIAGELEKPARDPRDEMPRPILRSDILEMKDLEPGMVLKGTVRNVIDFGAFVDIGVHQDGLVHISQMTDKYIKHPLEAVSVGDIVDVKILSVDLAKKRISLTMKGVK